MIPKLTITSFSNSEHLTLNVLLRIRGVFSGESCSLILEMPRLLRLLVPGVEYCGLLL